MKAEIIAVGTELLLGEIVNTNAAYLSQKLAEAGIDIYYQTVVGDNKQRLIEVLKLAQSRSDLIICTGGLGPTQDDLTKETIADLLGKTIIIDKEAMDRIEGFFKQRNVHMVESNRKQAEIWEGSYSLKNDNGLAVGVTDTVDAKHYMLLPGPPKELQLMFESYGLPWIQSLLPEQEKLYTRVLRFYGIGESSLEDELLDLISAQRDTTLATYAKEGEVTLRLATKSFTPEEAEHKLAGTVHEIGRRLEAFWYGEGEESLEEVVIRLLRGRGYTVSFAESCTGGLLSHLVTAIPGVSDVFKGSIVCYDPKVKLGMLGIPEPLLAEYGTVSEQTAEIMAEQCLSNMGTDVAVSITGVAGPDDVEDKPVGTVYIGIAERGMPVEIYSARFTGARKSIQYRASKQALYLLWRRLK
jgi:nicotinamide-nucleotide amidase